MKQLMTELGSGKHVMISRRNFVKIIGTSIHIKLLYH